MEPQRRAASLLLGVSLCAAFCCQESRHLDVKSSSLKRFTTHPIVLVSLSGAGFKPPHILQVGTRMPAFERLSKGNKEGKAEQQHSD